MSVTSSPVKPSIEANEKPHDILKNLLDRLTAQRKRIRTTNKVRQTWSREDSNNKVAVAAFARRQIDEINTRTRIIEEIRKWRYRKPETLLYERLEELLEYHAAYVNAVYDGSYREDGPADDFYFFMNAYYNLIDYIDCDYKMVE